MTFEGSGRPEERSGGGEASSGSAIPKAARDRLERLIIELRYAEADAAEFDRLARSALSFSRQRLEAKLNALARH